MFQFILVITGGALGSGARYLLSTYITKTYPAAFPYGTFAVNIIGCLLIGIIYGLTMRIHTVSPEWRLFFATGLCGGFTTFSAFAYENVYLLQTQNYTTFTLNTLGSFIFGFGAVFLGVLLAKPFA
jgi:CrcB protein